MAEEDKPRKKNNDMFMYIAIGLSVLAIIAAVAAVFLIMRKSKVIDEIPKLIVTVADVDKRLKDQIANISLSLSTMNASIESMRKSVDKMKKQGKVKTGVQEI